MLGLVHAPLVTPPRLWGGLRWGRPAFRADETRKLEPSSIHQYFLKVVPTTFVPLKGANMSTNQFSVTER